MATKTKTFTERLLAAQEAIGAVEARGTRHGSKGGGKYIKLEDLLAKVRPALRAEGLLLTHTARFDDGMLFVGTAIGDGADSVSIELPCLPESPGGRSAGLTPHALGSCLTYMRRYGIAALLGISDVPDDDGDAAQAQHDAPRSRPAPKPASNRHEAVNSLIKSGKVLGKLEQGYDIRAEGARPLLRMLEAHFQRDIRKPSDLSDDELTRAAQAFEARRIAYEETGVDDPNTDLAL